MINVLTTVYNAEEYVEKSLASIMGQNYKNFKCYITDDMSTDNSINLIKKMINGDDRFILIENKVKMYQPGNYDQIIRYNKNIDDNDIIVEVDGDDWLPSSNVFDRVIQAYSNDDIWITNGSFRYSNGPIGFSAPPKNFSNIRQETFTASHLRTWKAFLWRKIKEEDLKDDNGNYWKVAGDLSFMFPMLEMAGEDRYKFMEEINYIYNGENPLNDHKVDLTLVNEIASKIRLKTKYQKL